MRRDARKCSAKAMALLLLGVLAGCPPVVPDSPSPPPTAPSGLAASAVSHNTISLSWIDNSTNETGFKVERSPDGSTGWAEAHIAAADAIGWNDTGLTAATAYYYRVRASNAEGDSDPSNTASAISAFTPLVAINSAGDSFTMGDASNGPGVSQTISYSFRMSKNEITNAEFGPFIADGGYGTSGYWTTNGWAAKTSGSWTQPGSWTDASFNGASQPVVGMSWYEAVAFCNWRSLKEGLTPAYDSSGQASLSASGYRLPTEVEWEYAAAKGGAGQAERIYAWGDTWDTAKAVCGATASANVGSKTEAGGDTPQGLTDMIGNAWEWCGDNWQNDPGVASSADRYFFVDDSQLFIIRGGGWPVTMGEQYMRCAYRYGYGTGNSPLDRQAYFGFRVVRR
jgi:formylglycine-generating enzyme required for sulfatase activity